MSFEIHFFRGTQPTMLDLFVRVLKKPFPVTIVLGKLKFKLIEIIYLFFQPLIIPYILNAIPFRISYLPSSLFFFPLSHEVSDSFPHVFFYSLSICLLYLEINYSQFFIIFLMYYMSNAKEKENKKKKKNTRDFVTIVPLQCLLEKRKKYIYVICCLLAT